jgi:hypothetical protein
MDVGGSAHRTRAAFGLAVIGVLASLVFYPLMRMYEIGQIQTWLDAALILALLLWLSGQRVSVGVLLALVCVLKCNLAVIVLWALLRREWRFVAGFAVTVGVLGVATLAIYGLAVNIEYLKLLSYLARRGESFVSNQAFNGLLNRAIFNGNNLVWDGTHTQIQLISWVYYATLATSIAIMVPCLWPRPADGRLASWTDFAIALMSFTLASPVAYEGHFGFLVPIFAMLLLGLARGEDTPPMAWFTLALAFALCANWISATDALAATHANVAQSYVFFGVLLLLGLLYRQRTGFAIADRPVGLVLQEPYRL